MKRDNTGKSTVKTGKHYSQHKIHLWPIQLCEVVERTISRTWKFLKWDKYTFLLPLNGPSHTHSLCSLLLSQQQNWGQIKRDICFLHQGFLTLTPTSSWSPRSLPPLSLHHLEDIHWIPPMCLAPVLGTEDMKPKNKNSSRNSESNGRDRSLTRPIDWGNLIWLVVTSNDRENTLEEHLSQYGATAREGTAEQESYGLTLKEWVQVS